MKDLTLDVHPHRNGNVEIIKGDYSRRRGIVVLSDPVLMEKTLSSLEKSGFPRANIIKTDTVYGAVQGLNKYKREFDLAVAGRDIFAGIGKTHMIKDSGVALLEALAFTPSRLLIDDRGKTSDLPRGVRGISQLFDNLDFVGRLLAVDFKPFDLSKKKLLIVDDNEEFAANLKSFCTEVVSFKSVHVCHSVAEGKAYLKRHKVDIVMSDNDCPGDNEGIMWLKSLVKSRMVEAAVLMSGKLEGDMAKNAKAWGIHFESKPFINVQKVVEAAIKEAAIVMGRR